MKSKGIILALGAAISNGTLGIFSKFCFSDALLPIQIALYRCVYAFFLISLIATFSPMVRSQIYSLRNRSKEISLLAFCGVLLLYVFETKAFALTSIANVSFTVYGTGILTVLVGVLFLKEPLTIGLILGILLILIGEYVLLGDVNLIDAKSMQGILYAFIGGAGYSGFIFFARYFRTPSSFGLLWWLCGLGSAMLVSFAAITGESYAIPVSHNKHILFMAIVPTLMGFYFTAKSVEYIEAGKAQVIEMSDPFFSLLFCSLFLQQPIGIHSILGGSMILLGVFISQTNIVIGGSRVRKASH
ncbi:MAG: DMT family transporter [Alphaproteobacteria bacterium]|nr:MAG: DMT family transporter [Alphaproteobacteria bacterium]